MINFGHELEVRSLLTRIADALDRAYPKHTVPPVADLFRGPCNPVDYLVEEWGETREDAEKIVATTKPQDEPLVLADVWWRN